MPLSLAVPSSPLTSSIDLCRGTEEAASISFTVRMAANPTPLRLVARFEALPIASSSSCLTTMATAAAHVLAAAAEAVADAADVHDDEVELFARFPRSSSSPSSSMLRLSDVFSNESLLSCLAAADADTEMGGASGPYACVAALLETVELFAVMRLRGGKGKAGFQKNLKRQGRAFTRAVRNGQIQTAGTATTAALRTPANRRFGGGVTVNTQRFANARRATGEHHRPTAAASSSPAACTDASAERLPSDHPIEQLKRAQAREQGQLADWASRMAAAIGNGLALIQKQKGQ